jgi:hypothetical protein
LLHAIEPTAHRTIVLDPDFLTLSDNSRTDRFALRSRRQELFGDRARFACRHLDCFDFPDGRLDACLVVSRTRRSRRFAHTAVLPVCRPSKPHATHPTDRWLVELLGDRDLSFRDD